MSTNALPEDTAFDKLCEELTEVLGTADINDEDFEFLADWLFGKLETAYDNGYQDALLPLAESKRPKR